MVAGVETQVVPVSSVKYGAKVVRQKLPNKYEENGKVGFAPLPD